MQVLRSWLQEYLEKPLPETDEVAKTLTKGAFELEGVTAVGDDAVIDVDVLPNRSHDALSHLGIARELSVLFDIPFAPPSFVFEGDANVSSADQITLDVLPETKVVRAMKRLAVDIKVGPSPEWLRVKLEALGQRSINNIVDITNFVMLETGQPVHAFDFDKLAGEKKHITIRMAKDGEEITVLDGKAFTLSKENAVIADDDKALDIAGVKGGAVSGIDEKTTRVVLSACTFNPTQIRKTSRGLGILTDASKRFEQGVSPVLAERAMARLSQLVTEVAGGKVSADVFDFYPRRRQPFVVGVSTNDVNRILGTKMSDAEVESILGRLGFAFEKVNPKERVLELAQKLVGAPYKYGASVSYDAPKEFDCSSFIAYVFAQAGVAFPRMAVDQFMFCSEVLESELEPGDIVFANRGADGTTEFIESLDTNQIRQTKVSHDISPGTILPDGIDHNGIYLGEGKIVHASGKWHRGEVVIENMQESPGFQKIVGCRRPIISGGERYVVTVPEERLDLQSGPGFMISGNTEDLVEEIGRVYGYDKIEPIIPEEQAPRELSKTFYYTQKIRDILIDLGFSEVMTYSFVKEGVVELANPIAEDKKFLRASLKESMREALEYNKRNQDFLGLTSTRFFEIGTVFEKEREYIQLAVVSSKGTEDAGSAVQAIEKELGAEIGFSAAGVAVIADVSKFVEELPEPSAYDLPTVGTKGTLYKAASPYPFVLRDIAVWTPNPVTSLEVEKLIREKAGELLVRMTKFDEFSKEGRTSYAYHLVFQSPEKTLSDEEINTIMMAVTDTLNGREGFTVR